MVLAAGLVGCTGGGSTPPPAATVPPITVEASTTTVATTSTTLGFAIPTTIDVPYVQRVLDEIYRLEGEAARHIYANKVPDAEFNARVEAIFGEPALGEAKSLYGRGAARGFDTFADPPGDPKVKVRDVVEATTTCILVRADLDFSPLFKSAVAAQPGDVIILSPGDILPFNPTGWGIVEAGVPASGRELTAC